MLAKAMRRVSVPGTIYGVTVNLRRLCVPTGACTAGAGVVVCTGAVSDVIMKRNVGYYLRMDTVPSQPSIPYQNQGVQRPSKAVSVLLHMLNILFAGLLLGAVISFLFILLPYDRVVVMSQPASRTVSVSSVRLSRGGFVAVFARAETGLGLVGESTFLPAGYYRNIVIAIDQDTVITDGVREYAVRLFYDNGDDSLDITADTPVLNRYGKVYQKRFWFLYPKNRVAQWIAIARENPLVFLVDLFIP